MNIWNADIYTSLTSAQRRAIEARVPLAAEGETQETAVEYLNRIGAGLAAVDSYVEADRQAYRDSLHDVADGLFVAGLPAEMIVPLAQGFAAASAEVRAQVVALLA